MPSIKQTSIERYKDLEISKFPRLEWRKPKSIDQSLPRSLKRWKSFILRRLRNSRVENQRLLIESRRKRDKLNKLHMSTDKRFLKTKKFFDIRRLKSKRLWKWSFSWSNKSEPNARISSPSTIRSSLR